LAVDVAGTENLIGSLPCNEMRVGGGAGNLLAVLDRLVLQRALALPVLLDGSEPDQVAALHRPVFHAVLIGCGGKPVNVARFDDLRAGRRPERVRGADQIRIEADVFAQMTGARATVAQ